MSIGGLISSKPSPIVTANGFKLTVLLANLCTAKLAVVYGKVINVEAPPVVVWYLYPNDVCAAVERLPYALKPSLANRGAFKTQSVAVINERRLLIFAE